MCERPLRVTFSRLSGRKLLVVDHANHPPSWLRFQTAFLPPLSFLSVSTPSLPFLPIHPFPSPFPFSIPILLLNFSLILPPFPGLHPLFRSFPFTPVRPFPPFLPSYCFSFPSHFSFRLHLIFTARCYASAVLAMGLCPSVSVCLSVTSRCSNKTAKHRITKLHHTIL